MKSILVGLLIFCAGLTAQAEILSFDSPLGLEYGMTTKEVKAFMKKNFKKAVVTYTRYYYDYGRADTIVHYKVSSTSGAALKLYRLPVGAKGLYEVDVQYYFPYPATRADSMYSRMMEYAAHFGKSYKATDSYCTPSNSGDQKCWEVFHEKKIISVGYYKVDPQPYYRKEAYRFFVSYMNWLYY